MLEQKGEALSNVNEIIVAVLTSVLETKTAETKEHIQRIRMYTRELLRFLYEHSDDKNGLKPADDRNDLYRIRTARYRRTADSGIDSAEKGQ